MVLLGSEWILHLNFNKTVTFLYRRLHLKTKTRRFNIRTTQTPRSHLLKPDTVFGRWGVLDTFGMNISVKGSIRIQTLSRDENHQNSNTKSKTDVQVYIYFLFNQYLSLRVSI